jgi:hypothetical protein
VLAAFNSISLISRFGILSQKQHVLTAYVEFQSEIPKILDAGRVNFFEIDVFQQLFQLIVRSFAVSATVSISCRWSTPATDGTRPTPVVGVPAVIPWVGVLRKKRTRPREPRTAGGVSRVWG